jgi:hypothetical protein
VILGSEKMHAFMVYKQNIVRIKSSIFSKCFKARFENLKDQVLCIRIRTLHITDHSEWTSKDGIRFVYLDCSGPRRDLLLKPVENLRGFVNKTVEKVDQSMSRILNSYQSRPKAKQQHSLRIN